MRQFKKFILNLFGIQAIVPKGMAYILIEKGGKLEAKGPSSFQGLTLGNVAFHVLDDNEGFAIVPRTPGKEGVPTPKQIPPDKFWETIYEAMQKEGQQS